jgi:lipid-A-disaccharide synthase
LITKVHRVMVIAGEASGDRIAARAIHQAKLIAEKNDGRLDFYGIGGEECEREGMDCYYKAKDMSVVGFVEVAKRAKFFKRVLRQMTDLLSHHDTRPDVLVLVDYPGFNIRLAREAKKQGVRVVYYVSPQVWAWHGERVNELKDIVDEMLVIFPFEEEIYRKAGLANAHFIGHPLCEMIREEKQHFGTRADFAAHHAFDPEKPWVVIYSGSRKEEVRRLLPIMAEAAKQLERDQNMQAIVVQAPTIERDIYMQYGAEGLATMRDPRSSHELMHHATAGILKSGTTTLEAALLDLPGVICYKTHPVTFAIGKRLVKLPYIGLSNIVIGKKVYPELLQGDCTKENIVRELLQVIQDKETFTRETNGLIDKLLPSRVYPSRRAAESILNV